MLMIHHMCITCYLWHRVIQQIKDGNNSKDSGYSQCDTRRRRTTGKNEGYPRNDHDQCTRGVHMDEEITEHSFKCKCRLYKGPVSYNKKDGEIDLVLGK